MAALWRGRGPIKSLKDHSRDGPGQTSPLSEALGGLSVGISPFQKKKKILNPFTLQVEDQEANECPTLLGVCPSCAHLAPTAGCVPTALRI